MSTGFKAMEILKVKARKLTDDQVLEGIWLLNKPQMQISTDERMVRAALIDIYIERTSPEAGDTLMDELGL